MENIVPDGSTVPVNSLFEKVELALRPLSVSSGYSINPSWISEMLEATRTDVGTSILLFFIKLVSDTKYQLLYAFFISLVVFSFFFFYRDALTSRRVLLVLGFYFFLSLKIYFNYFFAISLVENFIRPGPPSSAQIYSELISYYSPFILFLELLHCVILIRILLNRRISKLKYLKAAFRILTGVIAWGYAYVISAHCILGLGWIKTEFIITGFLLLSLEILSTASVYLCGFHLLDLFSNLFKKRVWKSEFQILTN